MGRYRITDQAASDLAKIEIGHVERGGTEENANLLILGFLKSFQTLADFPDIGTGRDYLKDDELAIPHGDYMIVYMKQSQETYRYSACSMGRNELIPLLCQFRAVADRANRETAIRFVEQMRDAIRPHVERLSLCWQHPRRYTGYPTESTCRISWEVINAAISHVSR